MGRRCRAPRQGSRPGVTRSTCTPTDASEHTGQRAVMVPILPHRFEQAGGEAAHARPWHPVHDRAEQPRRPSAEHHGGQRGAPKRAKPQHPGHASRRPVGRRPEARRRRAARIDMTPSARSIATEATESGMGTRSVESAYARTRSPPTLAGRNVPTNVLTKKMRITRPSDGAHLRRHRREQREPAPRHQRAVEERQADGDRQRDDAGGRGDAPDFRGVADPEQPRQQPERDEQAHPRGCREACSLRRWAASRGGARGRASPGRPARGTSRRARTASSRPRSPGTGSGRSRRWSSRTSSRCGEVLGLEVQRLGAVVEHVAERLRVLAVEERRRPGSAAGPACGTGRASCACSRWRSCRRSAGT